MAEQIILEEDPAVLVPAEIVLLELLGPYGPRPCGCVALEGQPLAQEAMLGDTEGQSGTRVMAAIWKHTDHWRREVPIKL